MTKEFLRRASGGGESCDSLLPPLPPAKQCARGTYYLPPAEYAQIKVLLAELNRDTGVNLSFATFLRLATAVARPRLEAVAQRKRKLAAYEVYTAILSPPETPAQ